MVQTTDAAPGPTAVTVASLCGPDTVATFSSVEDHLQTLSGTGVPFRAIGEARIFAVCPRTPKRSVEGSVSTRAGAGRHAATVSTESARRARGVEVMGADGTFTARRARARVPCARDTVGMRLHDTSLYGHTVPKGYRNRPTGAKLRDVTGEREIHFVTGADVLCGARLTEPWTVTESRVTCDECIALLLARARERGEAVRQAVYALTRIIRET